MALMSKEMHEYWRGELRLALLGLLDVAPEYTANSSILSDLARLSGAFIASRDRVMTELTWLSEQELVEVKTVMPGLMLATLVRRGREVVQGRVSVPGVAKPEPHV